MMTPFSPRRVCTAALCLTSIASGCGVAAEARHAAGLTSLYTATVQQELERFARQRDAIAQARVRNAGLLEGSALGAEQKGAVDVSVWRIADDAARLRLYDGILAGTNLAAQAQRELIAQREEYTKAVDAARGGVAVRSADLSRAAQTLASLAKPPDAKAELQFYLGFFKQVRKDLDSAQKIAQQDSAKAVEAIDAAPKPAGAKP
jgi:hypothetical protein